MIYEKKRDYFSKKSKTIALLICVAIFFFPLSAGCGGGRAKAKALMKKADSLYPSIIKKSDEIEASVAKLLEELGGKLREAKSPDPAWFKNQVEPIYSLINTLANEAKKAESYYEKITRLGGVEDYREYAELQIDIIDLNISSMYDLENLLKEAQTEISAGKFDPQVFGKKLSDLGKTIEKRSDKIEDWKNEADDLKRGKKL